MDGRPGRPGGGGAADGRLGGRRRAFGKRFEHQHDHELNDHTSESLEHQCVSKRGRPGCAPCCGSPATRKCAAGVSAAFQASLRTAMNPTRSVTHLVIVQEKVRKDLSCNVDLRRRRRGLPSTAQPADGCLLSSRRDRQPAGVLNKGWRPQKERAHGPSGTAVQDGGTGVQDRGTGPGEGRSWSAPSERRRMVAGGGPWVPWVPWGVLEARRGPMEPSVVYLYSKMCTRPSTSPPR